MCSPQAFSTTAKGAWAAAWGSSASHVLQEEEGGRSDSASRKIPAQNFKNCKQVPESIFPIQKMEIFPWKPKSKNGILCLKIMIWIDDHHV